MIKIQFEISIPQLGVIEELIRVMGGHAMSAVDELGVKIDNIAATATATNNAVEQLFLEISNLKASVIDGMTPEAKQFLDSKLDMLSGLVEKIGTQNT